MNKQEFQAWKEERRKVMFEAEALMWEILKENFGGYYPEECRVIQKDAWEMRVYRDATEYVQVRRIGRQAFKLQTDYGWFCERNEDTDNVLYLESNSQYTVVEDKGSYATVSKFWKSDGSRVKKVRWMRDVKETSKGRYVTIDGKREYITEVN